MNIGFLSFHLSERGTTTALYDYAYYNQKLLGNKSIIFYQIGHPQTFPEYEKKFAADFKCYPFNHVSEIEDIIKAENIDALYNIKYGSNDGILVKNCPNLVHAVFVKEPHGEKYAFVSRFLSEKYGSDIPYVPHLIDLPKSNENLRNQYNIPDKAIVFGGYGGKDSFNIPFVHQCINEIVKENKDIYFLFMNFDKNTIDHPQIIYLPPSIDRVYKVKFINTCDAMIHARDIGETFGLAIGEFSTCNKPIITFYDKFRGLPIDREHIRILGEKGIYYSNKTELMNIFRDFKKMDADTNFNCYNEYTPEKVMAIFEKVFLNIVSCEYNNKRWTVFQNDGIGRHIINREGWEPHITNAFKALIQPGDIVLDIGANFGYHTITMAECVGSQGKVYAYEPERIIYNLLLRNINNNNYSSIVVPQNYAVINENIETGFTKINWLDPNQNMGDSYISNNKNTITCKNLDYFNFDKINLIKIDVQGAEILTLLGMEKTIRKHQPFIIIEIEEYTLNRFGHTSKILIEILRKLEYTIFYIKYMYPSDHLCVPNSKVEYFMNKYSTNIKNHLINNNINNNLRYGITQCILFN